MAMVCSPDEQKRLTVWAGTWYGMPAFMRRDPGHVHPLLAFGEGAADDDVLDQQRVDAGSLQQSLDGSGGQVVGPHILQFSLFRLAAGGAVGGQNICVFSSVILRCSCSILLH